MKAEQNSGYGYSKGYPLERYYRDAKLLEIGEGTSDAQDNRKEELAGFHDGTGLGASLTWSCYIRN